MGKTENYAKLKKLALDDGMAAFGVAGLGPMKNDIALPQELVERLSSGVVFGYNLSGGVLDTVSGAPNLLYYFHYQRVNLQLDHTALKLAAWIQSKGFDALPIPASQVVHWEKQLGTISHREAARLAGLGWYGRNNLLVNPKHGSRVRYATVLTDMPLKLDKPAETGCGSCEACVGACPAKAISRDSFDLALCSAKLKEFMKTEKIGQMICGVCVKACKGSENNG
jgi:epoxyqueuosine reductase